MRIRIEYLTRHTGIAIMNLQGVPRNWSNSLTKAKKVNPYRSEDRGKGLNWSLREIKAEVLMK